MFHTKTFARDKAKSVSGNQALRVLTVDKPCLNIFRRRNFSQRRAKCGNHSRIPLISLTKLSPTRNVQTSHVAPQSPSITASLGK